MQAEDDPNRISKREVTASREAELREAAASAFENAYCPYSGFAVGAAVLTSDGQVFAGCNVENASYGLTICAERSAIFQAVAAGYREIVAVAVYTSTKQTTAPCGSCRQVIHEFGPNAEIVLFAESGETSRYSLPSLLPDAFGPDDVR